MKILKISPKNVGLRFFLWAWEANKDKLNICKLFWGTVLLPIGVYIKKSRRPFHYLSPLSVLYLTCLVIPSLCLGMYVMAVTIFLFVPLSMLYNYVRREAIAIKCDKEDEKNKALAEEARVYDAELEARIKAGEHIFGERTERILEIIFNPIFWLINFAIEIYERFYDTRPGEQIVGFLSLSYYFLKSVKQKTCFLVVVE